ncbi:MAG: 4'-phosphopantetheinyl transferase superfamily protein [Bacteroidia bacterium]|nr:4'-phosphopantetheinyl transferase superfamily protein [Bacteroidia bacterium]
MPKFKRFTSGGAEVCIWENEPGETLTFTPSAEAEDMKPNRAVEWVSSRMALQELGVDLSCVKKDDFGKPHITNSEDHISISHCKQYAAAIRSPFAVGIDIEAITPRIERIATRFVNPKEEIVLDKNDRLTALYVLWGAKEALYKLYGKKAVDFREHMVASPFDLEERGKFYMEFLKGKPMLYVMRYEVFDNHVAVWVME